MSSTYVQTVAKALIGSLSVGATLVETENVFVDDAALPEQWMTLEFAPATVERVGLGDPAVHRESGEFDIVIACVAGGGVSTRNQIVVELIAGLHETISSGVRFMCRETAAQFGRDDGRYFMALLPVAYTYDVLM
jgi:hypothetical protein